MRRTTRALAVAPAVALALTGCLLPPRTPQQLFVEEAAAIIDEAGGVIPPNVPEGTPREAALLELGIGMCEGFESAGENGAWLFGVTASGFVFGIGATALAEAMPLRPPRALLADHA